MQLHLSTKNTFPGFEVFSGDLEEGISLIPTLRLVLSPSEVKRSGPLPEFSEAAEKRLTQQLAQPGVDPWLGQPVEVAFTFEPDPSGTEQCRPPTPREMFQGVVTEYTHDASGAFVVTVRPRLAL